MPLVNPLAQQLATTGTPVDLSSAAPPTAGQVLAALSATTANWQTPSAVISTFKQSVFAEVTVNTSTTSLTFVTLLTATITITAGSALLIYFTTSCSNTASSGQENDFQVVVNGTAVRGLGVNTKGASLPESGALVLKAIGLPTGLNTVLVQWKVAGGTGQVRPVATIAEHASLLVEEVTVLWPGTRIRSRWICTASTRSTG